MLVSAEDQVQIIRSKSRARESSLELVEFVRSKGLPRVGVCPKGSSIKSRTDVSFTLVRVGDLLGVDEDHRSETGRRPELARVLKNR